MPAKLKYKRKQVEIHNLAEEEIQKYKSSNYLWLKHVCGVNLHPHQIVYMDYFDKYQNNLLVGSRRIGKSFPTAMWFMKQAATRPYSEVNVHSPAIEQSKRNLEYMTNRIMSSEILMGYLENRLREGIGREYIEFANRSKIQAQGQANSVDGLGATHQWLEEFDDMDREIFLTRIFPTGSEIKMDYDYENIKGCRRIVTGTIKGRKNIYWLEHPDREMPIIFKVLPKLDCYDGIELGIIPHNDILFHRSQATPAQFARTYLVLYTESTDYFPTRDLNACFTPEFFPQSPGLGVSYPCEGDVTFGMDFEGRGETEYSSHTAITFVEQYSPGMYRWLYSKQWPTCYSPKNLVEEVVELCKYFKPKSGLGDAYDVTMIYNINKALFKARLTRINVDNYSNSSGTNGWEAWFFSPIRFIGNNKHHMFKKTQNVILSGRFKAPIIISEHPGYIHLDKLFSQLENIQATPTRNGYDSFSCINNALGDDLVDTLVAAMFSQIERTKTAAAFGGSCKVKGFYEKQKFNGSKFKSDFNWGFNS